jgi:hypothetical protein
MSYNEIVEQLSAKGYQVTSELREDDSIIINLIQRDTAVGFITFMISEQSTGDKRPTKYRVEDAEEEVCSIGFIEVSVPFQGNGFGYYLMLLASLYTKEHYPHITKVKLDDCSDRSGDVIGNLYFKTGMTPITPQKLLLPNEVANSVPLTNKRGVMHISPICGPERVGNLDDIIKNSLRNLNRGGKKTNKRKTNKRKTKSRKTKSRKTKSRKTNKK